MAASTAGNASFTAAFSVDQTPEEAFRAINNVRGWWSEDIEGATDRGGGEVHLPVQGRPSLPDQGHRAGHRRRAAWRVLDNYFGFTHDKSELKDARSTSRSPRGTARPRSASPTSDWSPESECFDVCSNSWDFDLYTSLRALIRTGHGLPNHKEQAPSA